MIKKISLYLFISIILSAGIKAFDPETLKIMPFIRNTKSCIKCHNSEEMKNRIISQARTCDIFCVKCHKKIAARHHKTGILIKGNSSAILPLTKRRRIACITCHDLTISRYDTSSWKAQSLFDRAFKSKKKYHTYYLRVKNNDGELCKKCH